MRSDALRDIETQLCASVCVCVCVYIHTYMDMCINIDLGLLLKLASSRLEMFPDGLLTCLKLHIVCCWILSMDTFWSASIQVNHHRSIDLIIQIWLLKQWPNAWNIRAPRLNQWLWLHCKASSFILADICIFRPSNFTSVFKRYAILVDMQVTDMASLTAPALFMKKWLINGLMIHILCLFRFTLGLP